MNHLEMIAQLRIGKPWKRDITPFLALPDAAFDALQSELRGNLDFDARVALVEFLLDLALRLDGEHQIRDRRIIATLLNAAATVLDAAYITALDSLRESCTVEILREFTPTLLRLLHRLPDPALFLLVARLHEPEALPHLRRLAESPDWCDDDSLKIAIAASGDGDLEMDFLKRFHSTMDPHEKRLLAESLGSIGTRTSLTLLARHMRSPLRFQWGEESVSVRVGIAKALFAHFPDKRFLSDPLTDTDYDPIEAFCEAEFGVKWSHPRPSVEDLSLAGT